MRNGLIKIIKKHCWGEFYVWEFLFVFCEQKRYKHWRSWSQRQRLSLLSPATGLFFSVKGGLKETGSISVCEKKIMFFQTLKREHFLVNEHNMGPLPHYVSIVELCKCTVFFSLFIGSWFLSIHLYSVLFLIVKPKQIPWLLLWAHWQGVGNTVTAINNWITAWGLRWMNVTAYVCVIHISLSNFNCFDVLLHCITLLS